MKILIFDLEVGGHHPGYLRHLLRYWPDDGAHLLFVVSPEFAAQHENVVQTASQAQVTWLPITERELAWYKASKNSLVQWAWVEWRLYCRYAAKTKADQGLVMYMDRFQLPLALQLSLPCQTSGIFFRPKFHYKHFADHTPARGEAWRALREQWLWRGALRHSKLKTLFCLDPFAVDPLRTLSRNTNVIALSDPIEWYPQQATTTATMCQDLGIDAKRKLLLLFGMLDRRKGIYQVLAAVEQLPPAQQAQLTLLLVGPLAEADRAAVTALIDALRSTSAVQILLRDQFIEDAAIQLYFGLADLILALYQRHVGMSAVLVRAAAAGKPVLASDYGLMGEIVRRRGLGVVVDSADTTAIAKEIVKFCEHPAAAFDQSATSRFAAENTAERFAQSLAIDSLR